MRGRASEIPEPPTRVPADGGLYVTVRLCFTNNADNNEPKLNNICGCNNLTAHRGECRHKSPHMAAYNQEVKVVVTTMWPRWFFYRFAGSTPVAASITNPQSIMETTLEKEVSVIDQLRQMDVGQMLEFPAGRSPYLRNLVSQRLINERLDGQAWSVNLDMENGVTIVTRTA